MYQFENFNWDLTYNICSQIGYSPNLVLSVLKRKFANHNFSFQKVIEWFAPLIVALILYFHSTHEMQEKCRNTEIQMYANRYFHKLILSYAVFSFAESKAYMHSKNHIYILQTCISCKIHKCKMLNFKVAKLDWEEHRRICVEKCADLLGKLLPHPCLKCPRFLIDNQVIMMMKMVNMMVMTTLRS